MKSRSHPLIVAIIPARFGSIRFPGKPLIEIQGKSLLQRTYENTKRCKDLNQIIIATDDQRIFQHVHDFGGQVVMTPEECATGTDRLAFVLNNDTKLKNVDLIVNVQGDEPCIDPCIISALIKILLEDPTAVMSTAVVKFDNEDEAMSPSEVKCVLSLDGTALYFSRTLIPGSKTPGFNKEKTYYKHLGIYAYRPDFLLKYTELPQTPLQIAEDLEQLKVIEHGYKIKAIIVDSNSPGVNIPEDIKKIEQELCKQNLFS
jgi:3-deoxy-manno-octulosonate cytidylyltransferase (CMP-KDO synthetase)